MRVRFRIRIPTMPQRIQPNRLESGIIQWMPVGMFWTIAWPEHKYLRLVLPLEKGTKRDGPYRTFDIMLHGLAYLCLFCPWLELGIIKRRFIKLLSFPCSLLTQRADDVSSYSIFQVKNKFVTILPFFYIKLWIRTFKRGKKGILIGYRTRERLHSIWCAK